MKYEVEVTPQGDVYWRHEGKLHRTGGLPAVESADGYKEWRESGKLHRAGGLPAIERADGSKQWWENDKPHRAGGLPAIKHANGSEEYWENGIRITKEEALKRAAPPPPLVPEYTVAQLQAMLGHTFKIVKE